MRQAMILARAAGAVHLAVISGPEIPIRQQMDRYKGLVVTRDSHTYAEIQLWTSDSGCTRRKKFKVREAGADLAAELDKLDLVGLCEFAAANDIELAGLGTREEIIAATVVTLKERHFATRDDDEMEEAEEANENLPPAQVEAAKDPGSFPPGPMPLVPATATAS